jgi:hypothetical protein
MMGKWWEHMEKWQGKWWENDENTWKIIGKMMGKHSDIVIQATNIVTWCDFSWWFNWTLIMFHMKIFWIFMIHWNRRIRNHLEIIWKSSGIQPQTTDIQGVCGWMLPGRHRTTARIAQLLGDRAGDKWQRGIHKFPTARLGIWGMYVRTVSLGRCWIPPFCSYEKKPKHERFWVLCSGFQVRCLQF